jgi:phage gp45-like
MEPNEAQRLHDLLRAPSEPTPESVLPAPPISRLPSGRMLRAIVGGRGEILEVRSPDGRLELRVRLTDEGPVLELDAARLDLTSVGAIDLTCERFAVRAREGVELHSDAEVSIRGQGNVHVDGDNVLLNCAERPAGRR